MKVYQAIASKIQAMRNCDESGNIEWFHKHHDAILALVRDHLPSGSGFDSGTAIDGLEHVDSKRDELRFSTFFHHMNDSGMYDGWSEHCIVVRPSLAHGFTLRVAGRDRNGIKEYIAEVFSAALDAELPS